MALRLSLMPINTRRRAVREGIGYCEEVPGGAGRRRPAPGLFYTSNSYSALAMAASSFHDASTSSMFTMQLGPCV